MVHTGQAAKLAKDNMMKGKIICKEKCMIHLRGINKIYNEGMPSELHVLKDIDLCIDRGSFVVIMGPSGSGKTTLLDIIGCLMKPNSGRVYIDCTDTGELSDSRIARIRGNKIGFIFQQYNLIPSLSAQENVELALRVMGKDKKEASARALELLKEVGLGERLRNKPSELSGGQQQRVAIARALANEPGIILGDEPTGNLDTQTGLKILDILKHLNTKKGYTIVVVTHDQRVAKYADVIISLQDGEIIRMAKGGKK
jgi:putative ABC transport system ATP-binding protein